MNRVNFTVPMIFYSKLYKAIMYKYIFFENKRESIESTLNLFNS